ncbi:MAG: hypothetical protein PUP92_32580 [Rhizonema sp. PD38]|nr:hypothetical protein [Rhizonema sp. PD38]
MESIQSISPVESTYFESACEEVNSLSPESYDSNFTMENELLSSAQVNSLSIYAINSEVEAWCQYNYDYLLL